MAKMMRALCSAKIIIWKKIIQVLYYFAVFFHPST